MTASTADLRRRLFKDFGQERFPERVPLNFSVLSKRSYLEYEEWKVEYDVQSAATMPVEVGRRVPAYLLIPKAGSGPFPAMLCLHQCGGDCTVGKEAVVGKVPWSPTNNMPYFDTDGRVAFDRSDQAYGYELVHEGFVVLAPDSINCGERNIEAIRQPGQVRICHQIIDPHLGMEAEFKRTIDGRRAIDVLQSLDFVDPSRLGAVGHSMGAGGVYWLMAFDDRVKAGIMGSRHMIGVEAHFYPLIAPRLLMALWGEFDAGDPKELQEAYDFAHDCYREAGALDNLLIRKMEAGHWFADEFKWEAYKRLKDYFGILPQRRSESLLSMVRDARQATSDAIEDLKVGFDILPEADVEVCVNREQTVSALAAVFLYLFDRSSGISLHVASGMTDGRPSLTCRCTSARPFPREPAPSGSEVLRGARQVLAEHDADLSWDCSPEAVICRIEWRDCA